MSNIVIDGKTYSNIESVMFNTPDGTTQQYDKTKEPQEKTVEPSTSPVTVTPDTDKVLSKVTVNAVTSAIDSNITSANIRAGVTVLGVEGNLEPDKPNQAKTVEPTTSEQVVTADTGYELESVTVGGVTSSIDSNITAENIRKDVTILGVTGTLEEGKDYDVESILNYDGTQTLNITHKDYVPVYPVFADNTPEGIAYVSNQIAQNGLTSAQVAEQYGWNLGDSIPITLSTGEVIEMQIIGVNHDDLSDGTGKAGLTLQMKNCLATRYPMNSTNTNAGGYAASIMKTSTLPTIKALLPKEWQDVIKLVDKKSANGGSPNYSETLTLSEDIFLLSGIEVFGSESSYGYAQDGANEGSQYEYWNGKASADRIKNYDTNADGVVDTVTIWWLRSSRHNTTNFFCNLDTSGNVINLSSASSSQGVAFGFCI